MVRRQDGHGGQADDRAFWGQRDAVCSAGSSFTADMYLTQVILSTLRQKAHSNTLLVHPHQHVATAWFVDLFYLGFGVTVVNPRSSSGNVQMLIVLEPGGGEISNQT